MDIRRLLVLAAILGTAWGALPGFPSAREAAARRPCSTAAFLGADISPGPRDSKPRELVSTAGMLFFTADDGVHGRELWKSSGTGGAGTSLVRDIRPGVATSSPRSLTGAGDKLFFTADDAVHGRELWVSDGSAQGTVMVKDIWPGVLGSAPEELLAVGEVVYFAAEDGVHGNELWRSDGTPEGTFLVEDLYPGEDVSSPGRPGSSSPRRLTRAGDAFYFVANEGRSVHLWRSLGVPGATRVFSAPREHFLFSLTPVGSRLFFLVDGNEGEASLWTSQGKPAEKLRSFRGRYPHDLTALGDALFFSVGVGEGRRAGDSLSEALWSSDGTVQGTMLRKELGPGAPNASDRELTALSGKRFFLVESPDASDSRRFVRSGSDLFFTATDAAHGEELWTLHMDPGGRCLGSPQE